MHHIGEMALCPGLLVSTSVDMQNKDMNRSLVVANYGVLHVEKYFHGVHRVFETGTTLLIDDCAISPSIRFALVDLHIAILLRAICTTLLI